MINGSIEQDNIAFGKPVLPQGGDRTAVSAGHITDGDPGTCWTAAEGDAARIDLGLVYDLTGAAISFADGSAREVSVRISEDGARWSPYWSVSGADSATAAGGAARYFLLEARGPVKIALFQAFGQAADTPRKTILILAPHPDDEAVLGAGIIRRALDRGDNVHVLVATLGDFDGVAGGRARMDESIAAMELLGLPPGNLQFLCYGDDGGLEQFGQRYTDSLLCRMYLADDPSAVFSSRAGRTETYNGARPSWHYQRHGRQAAYTRESFQGDLMTVIKSLRPDELYTTSRFDLHADHVFLYFFTVEAILHIRRRDPLYAPTIYEALVHPCAGDKAWPARNRRAKTVRPFTRPHGLEGATPLDWNRRVSITVPEVMRSLPADNLKAQALRRYESQYGGYLAAFTKYDEVFWSRKYDSLCHFATATASSERANKSRVLDQSAAKAIDGIADGFSDSLAATGLTTHHRAPFAEWVSDYEGAGAWLRLDWDSPQMVHRATLWDRPNRSDQVTGGALQFSDGSEVAVGCLPIDGRPLEISFAVRTVRWVRFVVYSVSASTQSVGLAELEVFGAPAPL